MSQYKDMIFKATEAHWGERCVEYLEGCPTCKAWKAFDVLTEFMNDDNDTSQEALGA